MPRYPPRLARRGGRAATARATASARGKAPGGFLCNLGLPSAPRGAGKRPLYCPWHPRRSGPAGTAGARAPAPGSAPCRSLNPGGPSSPLDTRHKCRDTPLSSHSELAAPPRRGLRHPPEAKPRADFFAIWDFVKGRPALAEGHSYGRGNPAGGGRRGFPGCG